MSNNIFDTIQRDESIDIDKLINSQQPQQQAEQPVQVEEPKVEEVKPTEVVAQAPVQTEAPDVQPKVESPENIKGLIINNKDLVDSNGPKLDFMENEERTADLERTVAEHDEMIRKRNAVTIIKNTSGPDEYIKMMDELNAVEFQPDGTAIINYKDDDGNPLEPEFIKIREAGDDSFDASAFGVNETPVKPEQPSSNKTPEEIAAEEERKNIINVIIDKTGMGIDFKFTEEEKAKLVKSDLIEVKEVKVLDVVAEDRPRTKKSFTEAISEYDYSGPKTTMAFPNSGYRADIKGMGSGEYADIALNVVTDPDTEFESVDNYKKKLTVVYNQMTNVSCGKFDSFDDFASKTAWTDLQLGIYGLYLSSEPEEQLGTNECPKCGDSHDLPYNTRSLLRLENASQAFLENLKKVASATSLTFKQVKKESPVETSKVIVTPDKKFIVELGVISCKEYMDNVLPLNDPDIVDILSNKYTESYVESVKDFLGYIHRIRIPLGDGSEYICETFEDIIGALHVLTFKDFKIVEAYVLKIFNDTSTMTLFNLVDVCPKCGHKSSQPILPEYLVFFAFHRMMSTTVNLKNITEV